MEKFNFSPKYALLALFFLILATAGVFTFLGWCTGDTTTTKAVTVGTFATVGQCNATRAAFALPTACAANGIVTTDLATWVGTITCTPHGRCAACAKISKATTQAGGAICAANPAGTFDLNCPMTYEVDCDCP